MGWSKHPEGLLSTRQPSQVLYLIEQRISFTTANQITKSYGVSASENIFNKSAFKNIIMGVSLKI